MRSKTSDRETGDMLSATWNSGRGQLRVDSRDVMDPQPRFNISEKTTVSLSLVVVLIGGIAWLTNVAWRVSSVEAAAAGINQQQQTISKSLQRIDRRLSRIEGKLGVQSRDSD